MSGRRLARVARGARAAIAIAAALVPTTARRPLAAQGVRVSGATVANYVELQPMVEDSVPADLTTGAGLVRQSALGTVSCPEPGAWCYFYRSRARQHTIPLAQDIELTGWGLGRGVSVYAHVRARANGGGVSQLWARESDHFDALAAYVEVDRERWRARAGRQWLTSQLGVNNFDGLALALRSRSRWRAEGYAGWSLIEGLSEAPTSGALAAADVLPPDVRGILLGASVQWRTAQPFAIGAAYQREIRTDRGGLYEERVAVDANLLAAGTTLTGALQADLATGALNEVRLRAARRLPRRIGGAIEGVHSTPFFPLWTIWGVFSPVGYNEVRAEANWRSRAGTLALSTRGGYRRYQDTHARVGFLPLRDDGWTVIGNASWRVRPAWEVNGSYRRDIGFGASKSDGNLGVRWEGADAAWIGITASALENIYEWRIAKGYVAGAALDAGVRLGPATRLSGQVALYRHIGANTPTTVDWSQRRAWLRLEWAVGSDPGMTARRVAVRRGASGARAEREEAAR